MNKWDMRHSHGTPSAHYPSISPTGDHSSPNDILAGPSDCGSPYPPQQSQLDSGEHAFPVQPSTPHLPETPPPSSSPSRPSEEPTDLNLGATLLPIAIEPRAHASDALTHAQALPAIFPSLPLYDTPFELPHPAPIAPPILRWNFGIHERGIVYPQIASTPTLLWPSVHCLCGNVLQLQVSSRAPHKANDRFLWPTEMLWIFHERHRSLLVTRWEPSDDGSSSTTLCPFCFRFIHAQWEFGS